MSRVYSLRSTAEVDSVRIEWERLACDRRDDAGPFDIIGDVHGCHEELRQLLATLGYTLDEQGVPRHEAGRRLLFLGDLTDRGPDSLGVLALVRRAVDAGVAIQLLGNHDQRLVRSLRGNKVSTAHGLDRTLAEIDAAGWDDATKADVADWLGARPAQLVFDDGRLVVAHAGLPEAMHGRVGPVVRDYAIWGERAGTLEDGTPNRVDWAADYRGRALVVYGHVTTPEATFRNETICLDTGCVYGGRLTALRYPERELVSVDALSVHCDDGSAKIATTNDAATDPARPADVLDIGDVSGRLRLRTSRVPHIMIDAPQTAAALETMSRFAVPPGWLVYLPPTMSPCETAPDPEPLLERPREALQYFRDEAVDEVICEQKHMGSRAILVVARDADVAARRFGEQEGRSGIVYSRTGRQLFDDDWTAAIVARVRRRSAGLDCGTRSVRTGWCLTRS